MLFTLLQKWVFNAPPKASGSEYQGGHKIFQVKGILRPIFSDFIYPKTQLLGETLNEFLDVAFLFYNLEFRRIY